MNIEHFDMIRTNQHKGGIDTGDGRQGEKTPPVFMPADPEHGGIGC